jgi:hypothetical protein
MGRRGRRQSIPDKRRHATRGFGDRDPVQMGAQRRILRHQLEDNPGHVLSRWVQTPHGRTLVQIGMVQTPHHRAQSRFGGHEIDQQSDPVQPVAREGRGDVPIVPVRGFQGNRPPAAADGPR